MGVPLSLPCRMAQEGGAVSAIEFRVIYRRVGLRQKARRFATRAGATRFLRLFGDEPWTAFPGERDPDAVYCCSGLECGCGGISVREYHQRWRNELPVLEFVRLEQRAIGPWGSA